VRAVQRLYLLSHDVLFDKRSQRVLPDWRRSMSGLSWGTARLPDRRPRNIADCAEPPVRSVRAAMTSARMIVLRSAS
jgi:hypothetical protein